MRKFLLPLVFLTAVFGLGSFAMVGCGGSSGGNADLAKSSKPDLLQPPEDFVAPPIGCAAFAACINATGCDQTCEMDCETQAGGKNGKGVTEFFAYYDCLHTPCGEMPDDMDAGVGACGYDPNSGAYRDPTACHACLMMVESAGTCSAQEMTCTNDTTGE